MNTITAPGIVQPNLRTPNKDLTRVGNSTRSPSSTKAKTAAVKGERAPLSKRQIIGVLIASIAVVITFGYWFTQSSFLDVDELKVLGVSRTEISTVLETSGLSKGDPLLGLELAEARSRIVDLPWVASVRSERSWSGGVTLSISERVAAAAIAVPGAWATVDVEGRVLELSDTQPADVAAVEGVWLERPAAGGWLDLSYLRDPLTAAAAMNELVRGAVRAIVISPEGVILDLNIPGYVLLKDSRNIDEKMSTVEAFLTQVNLDCLIRLDVRAASAPVLTRIPGCDILDE